MRVNEESLIAAAISLVLGTGGTHIAHRIGRARDTGRDEATIRREAKMEAAVENLLATSKELLGEVKALRKAKHEHANTLQQHENRIVEIERSLRVESGPIRVGVER